MEGKVGGGCFGRSPSAGYPYPEGPPKPPGG